MSKKIRLHAEALTAEEILAALEEEEEAEPSKHGKENMEPQKHGDLVLEDAVLNEKEGAVGGEPGPSHERCQIETAINKDSTSNEQDEEMDSGSEETDLQDWNSESSVGEVLTDLDEEGLPEGVDPEMVERALWDFQSDESDFSVDDEEEVEADAAAAEWSVPQEGVVNEHLPLEFSGYPIQQGRPVIQRGSSVLQVFLEYFKPVMEILVTETNRYYEQYATRKNIHHEYRDAAISMDVMKRFIAIVVNMGHEPRDTLGCYFSHDSSVNAPWYRETLSRHTFFHVFRFLHFEDSVNKPKHTGDYDKLWKIRKVFDVLLSNFQLLNTPPKTVILDEVVCATKGRVDYATYVLLKRRNFGMKLYRLSDLKGYTYNLKTGMDVRKQKNGTLAEQSVIDLCRPLTGVGHHLYMEKSFTSPALLRGLKASGILACGFARASELGMPGDFKRGREDRLGLRKHDVRCRTTEDGLTCVLHYYRRSATILSTIHRPIGEGRSRVMPQMIKDFNKCMKCAESSDEDTFDYSVVRTTKKWTKKLFFFLLDTTLLNAHLAYTSANTKRRKYTFSEFRRILAIELVSAAETGAPDPSHHFPERIWRSMPCTVCAARNTRTDTYSRCGTCGVPLCMYTCFRAYHTQEDFSK